MTDKSPDSETEKTLTEREAEARARVRAEMHRHTSALPPSPGQPEVARLRKTSGHRTLIVCLVSFAVLIALALGGDHLLAMFKDHESKDAPPSPLPPTGAIHQARRDLGMDSNPFGLFGQHKQESPADTATQPAAAIPPEQPALNKATALADGLSSTAERENTGTLRSKSPPDDDKTTPLESVAVPPLTATDSNNQGIAKVTGVRRLGLIPDLYIPVDRYIPCSMMRRFVSDVGGRISCLISQDVYSASNHVILIPAGTVARGLYRTGALKHGSSRMFVMWTELRTPEPESLQIPLIDTEVTGQLGEAGIAGWIDNHVWQRFGNALMLSTVQDVAAAATGSSPKKNRNTDYTENTRAAAAEMAKTVLENSINIPPTLYLNQGDIIGIMTGTDIDFSSVYQLHMK